MEKAVYCPDARDGGGCKTEEENRRVDDHPWVLEQWIKTASIRWDRAITELERRFENQKTEEVKLNQAEDWPHISGGFATLTRQNPAKNCGPEQP